MLRQRAERLRGLIRQHLWAEQEGIFANKFSSNETFYRRISPTSFLPLFARAATDAQATSMVRNWLHSPKHFCIAPSGDCAGNADSCWWGLPSIAASDPAYDYTGAAWRGDVWGPLTLLTYWSLQEYDHLPVVRAGRQALVRQMSAMAANVWNANRHICERFGPLKGANDCTGGKFYHWGYVQRARHSCTCFLHPRHSADHRCHHDQARLLVSVARWFRPRLRSSWSISSLCSHPQR